jgi:FlaA1/EpsC-like NDP-sugar epimerase/UDP-N-acetylmuramyl pentapeptide phosphotransferase/UDP-N-acetylglucosamine-1-phosphate transferase
MFENALVALLAFGVSLMIGLAMIRALIPSPFSIPSERSLHNSQVHRGGGLGVVLAFFPIALYFGASMSFLLFVFLLWIVSSVDDWWGVRARWRLLTHVFCCVAIVLFWMPASPWFVTAFCVVVLVWALNLFNFMDGADGVAATMAVAGGACLAWLAANASGVDAAQAIELKRIALLVAAAALGFLVLNVPPAKLFMGDGGSTVIGLVLAAVSLHGWLIELWSIAVPLALFVPFWADATFTLVRRLIAGHDPTVAHRDHLYQRLVLAGLGHRGLFAWMIGWCGLSVAFAMALNAVVIADGAKIALSIFYGVVYLLVAHLAVKHPPINLLLNPRAPTALAFDLFAVAISWTALFWVRFNSNFESADFTATDVIRSYSATDVVRSLAYVVPIHAAVFVAMGLYRGIWRFASLPDMWLIVRASFVAAAATGLVFLLVQPDSFIKPRFVLVAQPFLLIILMGGARMAVRSWKEHRLYGLSAIRGEPVIVLGAGNAAANLIRQLQRSEMWRPVALLDDDRSKQGARLYETPVLGSIEHVARVAKQFGAQHAIIAMPNASHRERRRAVQLATAAQLSTLTVPAYDELLGENDTHARLRAIELEDLLGRDPVALDTAGLVQWFSGKTVLVTGAGGSIGRELCTQVVRFRPNRLVLLDISEFAAHDIYEHLQQIFDIKKLEVYVADVRNKSRIREILAVEQPAIVFHAAAYKHVPMTETVNAWEAVRNNTYGTICMAECAREFNVEKFVLVSTDKAVRPSSIMGASKRLAELACMSFPVHPTQFVGVRFGNVLGSNGSVIPKFRKQIEAGGPVTVTHAEMTRYFMSIPEAAQLVLQAGLLGQPGSLYVLDMGEPVKIIDLAKELIRLAKGKENAVPIVFTGLRRGEKMHEELVGDFERFESTRHEKVRRVVGAHESTLDLNELISWLSGTPPKDVHNALKRWVVDFKPPVA